MCSCDTTLYFLLKHLLTDGNVFLSCTLKTRYWGLSAATAPCNEALNQSSLKIVWVKTGCFSPTIIHTIHVHVNLVCDTMCVLTGYINLHTAKKSYLFSFSFSLLVFNFLLRFVCWTARPSQPCLRPWSHWQPCASTCRWTATRPRTRTSRCCRLTHVVFTLNWTWRNLSKSWVSTGLRTGHQSYLIRISLWPFLWHLLRFGAFSCAGCYQKVRSGGSSPWAYLTTSTTPTQETSEWNWSRNRAATLQYHSISQLIELLIAQPEFRLVLYWKDFVCCWEIVWFTHWLMFDAILGWVIRLVIDCVWCDGQWRW